MKRVKRRNNFITFLATFFITGALFAMPVYAGSLVCAVRTSACSGGEVEVFEMESTTNSHAGLPAAGYTNLVCCGAVTGLGTTCSGTFATALKLSGTSDAHVRQGTLADYPSATNACLSVPAGGSVSVGYQATDCSGFDTTLASMIGTTNSHVGNGAWAGGTTKICGSAHEAGTLTVDIVNAGGGSVATPSIVINPSGTSFTFQTVAGTFGASDQKIRVTNTTLNHQWGLSIAALDGPTGLYATGIHKFDFNDPTASAVDGPDADAYGGQLTINPAAGTLAGTCSGTGITQGSSASYSEGVTNSITLLTAGSTADSDCYWDLIDIGITQTIPAEQSANNYKIDMTLSIIAI